MDLSESLIKEKTEGKKRKKLNSKVVVMVGEGGKGCPAFLKGN